LITVSSPATPTSYGNLLANVKWLRYMALMCCVLLPALATGDTLSLPTDLDALTTERKMLTKELEQYETTLDILQSDDTPPEQSSNPAVKRLALEMVSIKTRLIAITEKEVTLLQEKILAAKEIAVAAAEKTPSAAATTTEPDPARAIESKPLRSYSTSYGVASEEDQVERLHQLLATYYAELQESARTLPTEEELNQRQAAQKDAAKLNRIPFSVDKVRLNGEEGSMALGQITQRLIDPTFAESRRDIAPICSIKTRLFGSLVGSESRSLKPVGKNHYIARIRLQPGDTTLTILDHKWQVRLPQDVSAAEFLVTLYRPRGRAPELHVFAINDLLAEDDPHIPAWLPKEIDLKARAG
jgi:hypothetical protein